MAEQYEVTDVREITRFTAGGGEETYVQVYFRTPQDATGEVRIPSAEYSKERLQEELADKAEELESLFDL